MKKWVIKFSIQNKWWDYTELETETAVFIRLRPNRGGSSSTTLFSSEDASCENVYTIVKDNPKSEHNFGKQVSIRNGTRLREPCGELKNEIPQ